MRNKVKQPVVAPWQFGPIALKTCKWKATKIASCLGLYEIQLQTENDVKKETKTYKSSCTKRLQWQWKLTKCWMCTHKKCPTIAHMLTSEWVYGFWVSKRQNKARSRNNWACFCSQTWLKMAFLNRFSNSLTKLQAAEWACPEDCSTSRINLLSSVFAFSCLYVQNGFRFAPQLNYSVAFGGKGTLFCRSATTYNAVR